MRPPSPRRAAAALVLLAVAPLLAGCGDDTPAVGDFAAGACRSAAPDVLAMHRTVAGLGMGPAVPDADKKALRTRGAQLLTAIASAPGRPAELQAYAQSVGLLRLRADGNEYAPSLADNEQTAYGRLLARCTTAS